MLRTTACNALQQHYLCSCAVRVVEAAILRAHSLVHFRSGFTLAGDRSTGDVTEDVVFLSDSILTNGSWGVVRRYVFACMNPAH